MLAEAEAVSPRPSHFRSTFAYYLHALSFHLDVFAYLTPSPVESPFYQPSTKLFSLPALLPFLANLVELTFAPLFGDTVRFAGNLDEILLVSPSPIEVG